MKIIKDKIITDYIDNKIVLDIETTGVSRVNSQIVICGLLYPYDGKKDNFIQYHLEDPSDEKILLEAIYEHIHHKDLVTYNGISFDLPFIKDRFKHHGLSTPQENSNEDVYRILLANKKLLRLNKFSLVDAESFIGIERLDSFNSHLNKKYQEQVLSLEEKNLLVHNRNDLINTEKILHIKSILTRIKTLELFDEKLYLTNLYIDKDYLYVKMNSNKSKNFHFESPNQLVSAKQMTRLVKIRLFKAYISQDTLGLCLVQETPYIADNSPYSLPENILLVYSNKKYYNFNIKNMVKKIYRELPL